MATLLLAEVAGGQLNEATARAVTAALELGGVVDVLVAAKMSTRPQRRRLSFRMWRKCLSPTISLRAWPGGAAGGVNR